MKEREELKEVTTARIGYCTLVQKRTKTDNDNTKASDDSEATREDGVDGGTRVLDVVFDRNRAVHSDEQNETDNGGEGERKRKGDTRCRDGMEACSRMMRWGKGGS